MRKFLFAIFVSSFFSLSAFCRPENCGRGLYYDLSFKNRFLLDMAFTPVFSFENVVSAREGWLKKNQKKRNQEAGTESVEFFEDGVVSVAEAETLLGEEQAEDAEFLDGSGVLAALDGKDDRGIQEGDEKKEEIPEFVYYDRNGEVRRFSYDGEQMSARKRFLGYGENGEEIFQVEMTSSYGKKVKRRVFDEEARLVSSETFSIGSNSKDFILLSSRKYSYSDGSKIPSKSSETDFSKNTSFDVTFNESGLVLHRIEYSLPSEDGEEKDKKSEKSPLRSARFEYDEKGRVVTEENAVWTSGVKTVRKKVYKFTETSQSPDFEYYEDGILRLRREYDDEKNFYERTFMEDGFSILSYFEDGVKFYEIVYLNDVEVRRKYYDF